MNALNIVGLSLILVGSTFLAWRDLTAKRPTWSSQVAEPSARRRAAWIGFPMIALGSALQIIAVATG
jgi:hypothetical protein